MPELKMDMNHQLGEQEALRRIKGLLGQVKSEFADQIADLRENWSGNGGTFSFRAMGFVVSGTLTVEQSNVQLNGKLPFAAGLFKGKIERIIRERAVQLLA